MTYDTGILLCHRDDSDRYIPIENGEIYIEDVLVIFWVDEYIYRIHRESLILIDRNRMNIAPEEKTISYHIIPKMVIRQLIEDIMSRNFEICEIGGAMYEAEEGQKCLSESGEELVSMSEKLRYMLEEVTDDEVFIINS